MKNITPFHDSLKQGDTENKTVGCRHTNPDICGKNLMPEVCAFCREDGICMSPPASWKKQFQKLKKDAEKD